MGGSVVVRAVLCAGTILAAASFNAPIAAAQDAGAVVNLTEPRDGAVVGPTLALSARTDPSTRFAEVDRPGQPQAADQPRNGEIQLAAGGRNAPVDVSIAQRASFGADPNGDLNHQGRGSEVRIGRGLVRERSTNTSDHPTVYAFVASDDQALTWAPGSRNEMGMPSGGVSMQDRVEMGDRSAGVTYERNGVQASLAYVERSESARVGGRHFNQDQNFAGVTVTMRH